MNHRLWPTTACRKHIGMPTTSNNRNMVLSNAAASRSRSSISRASDGNNKTTGKIHAYEDGGL